MTNNANYPSPYSNPGQQHQTQQYPGNGYPGAVQEGEKDAKTAWILGLIGLFFFGIILGPIALFKAYKAKSLGASATAGFVLGALATLGGILNLIIVFSMFSGQ